MEEVKGALCLRDLSTTFIIAWLAGGGGRGASTTTVSVKSITLDGAPIYSFTVNES